GLRAIPLAVGLVTYAVATKPSAKTARYSAKIGVSTRAASGGVTSQCQTVAAERLLRAAARSDLLEEERALDVLDVLSHGNIARACFRAVEDGAAAPHAGLRVQDAQSLGCALVAAVVNEPSRVDDRGGADKALVGPRDRASRRARRAKDALRGVFVPLELF